MTSSMALKYLNCNSYLIVVIQNMIAYSTLIIVIQNMIALYAIINACIALNYTYHYIAYC